MIKLMLGDCLEAMGEIPAGSIDLILADLPYGTTACKWDVIIPFEPLWIHYRRLLKPRGAVVLTASQPFTSMLVMSNREWFKYCLVWEKALGSNHLNAPYRPLDVHEDVCVFSPVASTYSPRGCMTYNPQMMEGEPYRKTKKPGLLNQIFRSPVRNSKGVNESGRRYPVSIVYVANAHQATKVHRTQKPVALMEYLIRTYSNEGETVLDNTMGSGTTGEACLNTGRSFIGIESHEPYFRIAEQRIKEAEGRKNVTLAPLLDRPPTQREPCPRSKIARSSSSSQGIPVIRSERQMQLFALASGMDAGGS